MSSKEFGRRSPCDHADAEESPMKRPRTISELNITSLNVNCLLQIFSYVSFEDLCALKSTCEGFSDVADYIHKRKYGNSLEIHSHVDGESIFNSFREFYTLQVKHFGHIITAVRFENACESFECLKYPRNFTILQYCSALENLTIFGVNLRHSIRFIPAKSLRNVISLDLDYCEGSANNYKFLLRACNPRKLTSLRITPKIGGSTLASATKYLVNLESLKITLSETCGNLHLQSLKNLKKLKILRIWCKEVPILSALVALENNAQLDELMLIEKDPNEDIAEAIKNLKMPSITNPNYYSFKRRK